MTGSKALAGAVGIVALLAAGCASINTTTNLSGRKLTADGAVPVAHVYATTWGVYILSRIPIAAGDYDSPIGFTMFRDTVKPKYVADLVTRQCKELDAPRAVDLQTSWSSTWIGLLLPILTYESAEASANAVR